MELEDRVTIATPEGVELELVLAGAGSRASASLLDTLVKFAVFLAFVLLARLLGGVARGVAIAAAIVLAFILLFVYDVVFEVFASGRTPGKRWSNLRVVREGGRPVGLGASCVRNVLRVVDILPGVYAVGLVALGVTARNQRLGDLAAGTLVVREVRDAPGAEALPAPSPAVAAAGWDVSSVSSDDLAAVRQFLSRRGGIAEASRRQVAGQLADGLRPKVGGAPADLGAETFLETLYAVKSAGAREA